MAPQNLCSVALLWPFTRQFEPLTKEQQTSLYTDFAVHRMNRFRRQVKAVKALKSHLHSGANMSATQEEYMEYFSIISHCDVLLVSTP